MGLPLGGLAEDTGVSNIWRLVVLAAELASPYSKSKVLFESGEATGSCNM